MQEIFYAALLGAVQGLSEFLPISSSAHLIVLSSLVKGQTLPLTLNVALHLGTAMAVLVYFSKDWWQMARETLTFFRASQQTSRPLPLLFPILVGSIPAGFIGVLFKDAIEAFFHNPSTVIAPLIIVGLLLWWTDRRSSPFSPRGLGNLTLKDGFIIGVAQAIALIPGVSRSGATIITARLTGFSKEAATRFSFLLGTPAIVGAALLEGRHLAAAQLDSLLWVGILASFLVGIMTIGFFMTYIQKINFFWFAMYRLVLAVILCALLMIGIS